MPKLTEEVIRDRLRVKSLWILPARTPFFTATEEHMTTNATTGNPMLQQRYQRYIVSLLFQPDNQNDRHMLIEKIETDGTTFRTLWSDIYTEGAVFPRQLPEGAYDLKNPIYPMEGGSNMYGRVDGVSQNLTVTYWDNDI